MKNLLILSIVLSTASALVPLLDGGKQMPKLYDGWMNDQIAKQASTGVANAIAAGYDKIEVQFPPVPNLDEVGNRMFQRVYVLVEYIYIYIRHCETYLGFAAAPL